MALTEYFRRLFGSSVPPQEPVYVAPSGPAPKTAFVQVVPADGDIAHGVPRYPPIDSGIKVASIEELLAGQKDLITKLRRSVGVSDTDFDTWYLGPLRRAAAAVNLLPATRDKHHTGAGGLFRFAVNIAVQCEQSSNGLMFAASESIEFRRKVEEGWRYTAFLAGLISELYRPLTEFSVVATDGSIWNPYVLPLNEWATQHGTDRFFIRWHSRESVRQSLATANTLASSAVSAVAGPRVLARLHEIKPKTVESLFGVVSGTLTSSDSSLAKLVADVRRRVIEADNSISPLTYGKLTTGTHLEPYFLDAMRGLVASGLWKVNSKGARVHWGSDGMFIAWATGHKELIARLHEQKIAGIPTERRTLDDMLGGAGIITVAGDGSWIHVVHPSTGVGDPFPAVRIESPTSILGHIDAAPVAHALKAKPASAKPEKVVVPGTAAETTEKIAPPHTETAPNAESDTSKTSVASGSVTTASPTEAKSDAKNESSSPSTATNQSADHAEGTPNPVVESGATEAVSTAPKIPRGGIPSVPDVESAFDSAFDTELRVLLGDPLCREVIAWREAWNRGQHRKFFLHSSEGLAISHEMLVRGALPLEKVVEKLKENGYLVIKTEKGRERSVRKFPFAEKEHMGICLTQTLIRKAGFVTE